MTEERSEDRGQKSEDRRQMIEVGSGNAEVGKLGQRAWRIADWKRAEDRLQRSDFFPLILFPNRQSHT